jgi:hypothetical protein
MAQAQMPLGFEQKYAQKLLQLAEDKSKYINIQCLCFNLLK